MRCWGTGRDSGMYTLGGRRRREFGILLVWGMGTGLSELRVSGAWWVGFQAQVHR